MSDDAVASDRLVNGTAVPDPAPHARRTGVRRAWVGAAAVVVAAVLGAVIALAQPGGYTRGDVTEHFALATPAAQVTMDEPQDYTVVPQDDRFAGVAVVFATYVGTIDCTLESTLTGADGPVASSVVDCADLADNAPTTILSFDPIDGLAGQDLTLTLVLARGSLVGPSVWESTDGTFSLLTYYDPQPRMVDRVGEVLARMADYGPAWAGPAGIAPLALAALCALVVLAARPRWGLAAVVVLVVARGLVWSVLVPPLQGMDEGAHFADVQYIAESGRLPNWNTADRRYGAYSESLTVASEAMHVSAHPPTDRPDYGPDSVADLAAADAAAAADSDGTGPAASYPPGYYGPAAAFYLAAHDSTVDQVHAIRLWSTVLGVVAIVFAWLFATELWRERRTVRAALVTAVALQPMVAHQFSLVNNDALVIAAGFGALWLGARILQRERAPWSMLAAGAMAGAGALGKPFAAVVAIPVAVAWLGARWVFRTRDWRVLVLEPALALAGVLVTYGSWLVCARLLDIDTGLGFPSSPSPVPRGPMTYLATQWDPGLSEFRGLWVTQLWGNFGWVDTPLPSIAYTAIWVVYLVLTALVLVWLALRVRSRLARVPEPDARMRQVDRLLGWVVVSGVGTVLAMYLIEYGYYASSGKTDLLQGRYLLLTVPALLALPTLLAERLVPHRWAAPAVAWAVAAAVFALHLTSVLVVVRHFYL